MTRRLDLPAHAESAPPDSITFIGNATVLLRLNGITLLTDPNFLHAGDHAHLGYGMTSERLKDPAIDFHALPPFDAVLLSHYHGDHFDQFVERKLPCETRIVTTVQAARTLAAKGFSAVEALTTWESLLLHKAGATLTLTALPGRHGPAAIAAALPPVMGSMLAFQRPDDSVFRMYVSGDTLVHAALREIPARFPYIDVALIHLGGTRIMGILVTLDGKGGVAALRLIDPRLAIPIHYEEYTVMKSPLADFTAAVERAGYSGRVRYLERSETYSLENRPQ